MTRKHAIATAAATSRPSVVPPMVFIVIPTTAKARTRKITAAGRFLVILALHGASSLAGILLFHCNINLRKNQYSQEWKVVVSK